MSQLARARHRIARLALLACALACALKPPAVARAAELGDPPLEEARAAIVCDRAGNVLWEREADAVMAPASITKVMTAMVALDSGKPLTDVCEITDTHLSEISQLVGFAVGDQPTFGELIEAMLVYSGNDAADNVALNVCDTLAEFVGRMNVKAAELGMASTHFANAHGLEDVDVLDTPAEQRRDDVPYGFHYSTARDLAVMGRHALTHYPFIAHTVRKRSVSVMAAGSRITLESTDDLMESYPGLLGIKTGAVASGYTFLGASGRDGLALFTCVLGCSTPEGRFSDTAALMDWAYANYRRRRIAGSGWVLRVCGFADNFALKCVVRTPEDGVSGLVWPAGDSLYYHNAMAPRGLLVSPKDAYGAAWWRQDGRLVCGSEWRVEQGLWIIPSWPMFMLPLFCDLDEPALGAPSTS